MPSFAHPGSSENPARQTLYRFWSAADELLYVGITVRPWDRWRQHAGEKPWWEEVAKVTLEAFDTREAVRAAELEAIRTEGPRYNVADVPRESVQQGVSGAPSWDGVHRPNIAFIGDYLWCDCAEPEWDDDVRRVDSEWIAKQPLYTPDTYAAHVIEAVLGERFAVVPHAARATSPRRPSVKFVHDMWPEPIRGHLPRQWKRYVREWIEDDSVSRAEVKESIEIALDAWRAGKTENPWAYLGGIVRRIAAEKAAA